MEISKIREMAKFFADIPIYDTRVGGVASHPFTNTWITGIYDKDRKLTFVDLRKQPVNRRSGENRLRQPLTNQT